MRAVKIRNVFYCYHPNGQTDENEPLGYKILDGGKWVVEWDIIPCGHISQFTIPDEHYTAEFKTEKEAIVFYNIIMGRVGPEPYMASKNDKFTRSYKLKK